MKLPPVALLAAAFVIGSGWATWRLMDRGDSPPPAPELPVPAIDRPALLTKIYPDLEGRPQALAQWRGKVIVANYWATWCPPCKAEMPDFSRLHVKHQGKGVQFVGISIDSADKIIQFQKETPVSYPLLVAPQDAIETSVELGNTPRALPFTVVFNREGRPAAVRLGRYEEAKLESLLKDLLR